MDQGKIINSYNITTKKMKHKVSPDRSVPHHHNVFLKSKNSEQCLTKPIDLINSKHQPRTQNDTGGGGCTHTKISNSWENLQGK